MPKANFGPKNGMWKGGSAGNKAIHAWVRSKLGNPKSCLYCKKISDFIDWANKDHKYKRKLSDYMPLCRSCHRKYDFVHNNKEKNYKEKECMECGKSYRSFSNKYCSYKCYLIKYARIRREKRKNEATKTHLGC